MTTVTNPYLAANFAPVRDEVTAANLPVTGAIPPALRGRYLRNGPNPVADPDLEGADEPDLSVTPFCNTLALRRFGPPPGGARRGPVVLRLRVVLAVGGDPLGAGADPQRAGGRDRRSQIPGGFQK